MALNATRHALRLATAQGRRTMSGDSAGFFHKMEHESVHAKGRSAAWAATAGDVGVTEKW